ncbi:MAG: PH domain-containing protein [Nitriliruptoraceae bacterium]|nr:PH domain-containing protein [Nitriliruptoraceae bacterium]
MSSTTDAGAAAATAPDIRDEAALDNVEPPGLDDRERPLAPNVIWSWRIGTTLSLIFPTIIATVISTLATDGVARWVLLGFAALWGLLVFWYHPARYRRWRWRLTDLAVDLRYGVITRQQETVPYFRIQQIDLAQGPLDRLLHLTTLQVTTASASGSAALPGIHEADAPGVRAELLARAAAAVADHPGDLRDAV